MTEPSLWVYLDDQLDEALKLLEDPDYEVINKVDMAEFYEVADNIAGQPASLNAALVYLGVTMGLVLMGLVVLFKALEWMTT